MIIFIMSNYVKNVQSNFKFQLNPLYYFLPKTCILHEGRRYNIL